MSFLYWNAGLTVFDEPYHIRAADCRLNSGGLHVYRCFRALLAVIHIPLVRFCLTRSPPVSRQNGDYPFKFGTYMGCDGAGNRYYENRVDYPFGQHRWVEPGDINNFDSASIPPEWQGWMTSMNDATPTTEDSYLEEKKDHFKKLEDSDAPDTNIVGLQQPFFNFHHLHNQSQVRSRGYNIGNPITGLPPGAPDAYYTQPGSPYNPASIRPLVFIGDLDAAKGGGRPYKSDKWAARLRTAGENATIKAEKEKEDEQMLKRLQQRAITRKAAARGGTIVGK